MKNNLLFTGFILLLLILTGCNDNGDNSNTSVSTNETGHTDKVEENMVRLTISINNGEQFINEQEVKVEEGDNLLKVLEETFYVETNEEDLVISIERMQVDEEGDTSWVLFVNDEKTDIAAKDYNLNGGERITFDLQ